MTANDEQLQGFLVVLCSSSADNKGIPVYHGIDRVPPYPSPYTEERAAMDKYVFGKLKDANTNLIPSLDVAVSLLHAFAISSRRFEIVFCCSEPKSQKVSTTPLTNILCPLGFDVAAIPGDYWSIVG